VCPTKRKRVDLSPHAMQPMQHHVRYLAARQCLVQVSHSTEIFSRSLAGVQEDPVKDNMRRFRLP
jgi:hypothetical protein